MKTSNQHEKLVAKIKSQDARLGVVGLGYVGLPLAVAFAEAGFHVTGLDVSPEKVREVKAGRSYIPDVPSPAMARLVESGRLTATTNPATTKTLDAVVFCVPTPLRKTRDPDISYIMHSLEALSPHMRKGQLIILESTTYPGTTREILLPKLADRLGKPGRDFFLAFSPERIDPGQTSSAGYDLSNTPKVVGGITPACGRAAAALYGAIVQNVVTVSSAEAAEMSKILENTFRAVNIGLANEMALVCRRLGLDVWEVIRAAATKPYGFMPFFPGPGLGGHCIPVDPKYLTWKMHEKNFHTRFINLADEINTRMPEVVVERISQILNEKKKSVAGARILLLGMAYKKDTSDTRESPALNVLEHLIAQGARVGYSDPYIDSLRFGKKTFKNVKVTPKSLRAHDMAVVLTNHSAFDPAAIARHARILFDTRGMTYGMTGKNIHRL